MGKFVKVAASPSYLKPKTLLKNCFKNVIILGILYKDCSGENLFYDIFLIT